MIYMTYNEACAKALAYFNQEFERQQAVRKQEMLEKSKTDPWVRGIYHLYYE